MENDYLLGDRLQELTVAICQELPDGWMIRIGIDNGWAGVTLVDPNDEEHDMGEDGTPFRHQITNAIEIAQTAC